MDTRSRPPFRVPACRPLVLGAAATWALAAFALADDPQSALRPAREYIHADGRTLAVTGPPPSVEFSGEGVEGTEGGGPILARIVVHTSGGAPLSTAVHVRYHTEAGTAAAGEDFVPATGTLTFEAGSPDGTERAVAIEPVNDTRSELTETLSLMLSGVVGAMETRATMPITILDDDPPPSLRVESISVPEGKTGTSPALLTLSLSGSSGLDAILDYASEDGTAEAGSDYLPTSGTVSILAGETAGTIAVPVVGDPIIEPDESFTVRFSLPRNVTLDVDRVGITIVDDDLPSVQVLQMGLALEGPRPPLPVELPSLGSPGVAVFRVRLGFWAGPASIEYRTENDTAVAGEDFVSTSGTLRFDSSTELTQYVRVPIIDDSIPEDTESFRLVLDSPSGAVRGGVVARVGILDNDSPPPPPPGPEPMATPVPQASPSPEQPQAVASGGPPDVVR